MSRQNNKKSQIKLSDKDKKIPIKLFICNWPKCRKGKGGKPALSERLCPFCHKVGYCCIYCLEIDIDRHIKKECQQNIKKSQIIKKLKSKKRSKSKRKSKRKN